MKKRPPWERNWLEKIYWKIFNFFWREWYFICKVWAFAKLFRHDYDFDYLSLLPIIELKTRRTREYLVEENIVHVDERRMKEVEYLCKRIYADDYYSQEWDEYLGQMHISHKPWEKNPEWSEMIFNHDDPDHEWKRKYLHKKTEKLKDNELDRLFYLIRKYMQRWWS